MRAAFGKKRAMRKDAASGNVLGKSRQKSRDDNRRTRREMSFFKKLFSDVLNAAATARDPEAGSADGAV